MTEPTKFAVAFMDSYNNDLQITFVTGTSDVQVAKDFLRKEEPNWELPDTLEEIKEEAFNADCHIDVKAVP